MGEKMPLAGARVLVTGGGSGFGRLLACGAAQRGAGEVIVWDVSAERVQRTKAIIERHGRVARAGVVDVTNQAAIEMAAEAAGQVDVLINNAGVVSGRPLLENSPESIERTLQVNLHSLFWVTRAFLPGMVARNYGSVVTIASAAGLIGPARMTDYSASKFGAVGFNESLRGELRTCARGVNTLLVAPFYMNTGMFDGVKTRFPLLLPILDPAKVAVATLNAIESGKPMLVEPWFVNSVALLRLMPVKAFDALADFFGINAGMDEFHGRAGDRV